MNRCATSDQRSLNNGQPVIEFLTLQVMPPGFPTPGVNYDIPVRFQVPHRVIGVANMNATFGSSSVFIHFTPTFKNNRTGSIGIFADGTEPWIPLFDQSSGSPTPAQGRFVAFKKPVQSFFVSTDHPAGGTTVPIPLTLFGADSIEDALLQRVS